MHFAVVTLPSTWFQQPKAKREPVRSCKNDDVEWLQGMEKTSDDAGTFLNFPATREVKIVPAEQVCQRGSCARVWIAFLIFATINALSAQAASAVAATVSASTNQDVCTDSVSQGDANAGIAVVTDVSCKAGGLGCFKNVCRFCKVRDTPQSQHLLSCDRFSTAQVTSTPKPTPAPASLTGGQKCNIPVSQGDAVIGIDLVTDITCQSTPQSQHLISCDKIVVVSPTPSPSPTRNAPSPTLYGTTVPTTPPPTVPVSPAPAIPARVTPTSSPAPAVPSTPVPSTAPATPATSLSPATPPSLATPAIPPTPSTSAAPITPVTPAIPPTSAIPATATPIATSVPPPVEDCPTVLVPEAANLGLFAFMDPSCNGVVAPDCTREVCRLCKTNDHQLLSRFRLCNSFPSMPMAMVPPTSEPIIVATTDAPTASSSDATDPTSMVVDTQNGLIVAIEISVPGGEPVVGGDDVDSGAPTDNGEAPVDVAETPAPSTTTMVVDTLDGPVVVEIPVPGGEPVVVESAFVDDELPVPRFLRGPMKRS